MAEFRITADRIGTTFNVFMNGGVDPKGGVSVDTLNSIPGDHVALRADIDIDMICVLTACPAEKSNNQRFKPIDDEIITRPC